MSPACDIKVALYSGDDWSVVLISIATVKSDKVDVCTTVFVVSVPGMSSSIVARVISSEELCGLAEGSMLSDAAVLTKVLRLFDVVTCVKRIPEKIDTMGSSTELATAPGESPGVVSGESEDPVDTDSSCVGAVLSEPPVIGGKTIVDDGTGSPTIVDVNTTNSDDAPTVSLVVSGAEADNKSEKVIPVVFSDLCWDEVSVSEYSNEETSVEKVITVFIPADCCNNKVKSEVGGISWSNVTWGEEAASSKIVGVVKSPASTVVSVCVSPVSDVEVSKTVL